MNSETHKFDKNPESVNNLDEREASMNFKPSNWPGLNILGKQSHQVSSTSILGNLHLWVTKFAGLLRCITLTQESIFWNLFAKELVSNTR